MNKIQMVAIFNARDSLKSLWGDKWAEKIKQWKNIIRAEMQKSATDNELEAMIKLCVKVKDNQPACVALMAAAAEMIEPE